MPGSGQPPNPLPPSGAQPGLRRVRRLARAMDLAVRVPGTRFRVGLDALLGLVPGVGDVAGGVIAGYVLLVAARLGAPRAVLLRMSANVAIDTALGAVPFLGDLFDAAWKANARNARLLEEFLERPGRAERASRLFLLSLAVGLLLVLIAALLLALWVLGLLLGALS